MLIFKLGLLTCAFYAALTFVFEAGVWGVAYFRGLGVFVLGRHWFWTLGSKFGLIFGILWLISFLAAWWIVYSGLKATLPFPSN